LNIYCEDLLIENILTHNPNFYKIDLNDLKTPIELDDSYLMLNYTENDLNPPDILNF
jgi:hypothetical protein